MKENALEPRSRLFLAIVFIWLGFGLVDAAQTVFVMRQEGMHHAWVKLFVGTTFFWMPWAMATLPVGWLGRRYPPVRLFPVSTWAVHLAACSSMGLIFTAWTTWIEKFFHLYDVAADPGTFTQLWLGKFSSGILSSLFLYAGVLIAQGLVESRMRLAHQQTETARLNEQLSRAQLHALRSQIEPHFLFNTLNAISSLVRAERHEDAVTMIAALSDFLRRTLEGSTRQQVSLEEEPQFTLRYLDIQKARFEERLQLSLLIPSELYHAQVPSLILQPMVENAVKHGIAKRAEGGGICITAAGAAGELTLSVYNDGPALLCDAASLPDGIGLSNVRTRLRAIYGEAFRFSMRNMEARGVEAVVSLPLLISHPDRDR